MLEPKDLEQIRGIVTEVVNEQVGASEDRIRQHVKEVVLASEDRIVARINREITDLAEINQAVLNRFDHVSELQPARR